MSEEINSTRSSLEDEFRVNAWEKLQKEHDDAIANGDINSANAILEQMEELTRNNEEYIQRPKED